MKCANPFCTRTAIPTTATGSHFAYCDACKAWAPPERTTFGMSELVDEPFNYKNTLTVDSASEKS